MIIVEIFALLVSQIAKNFESTQIVWKFAGGYNWIKNIDRSVYGKDCRHFAYYDVDFSLNLEKWK